MRSSVLPAVLFLMSILACTLSPNRPAHVFSDATGGEGLERVFWKEVKAKNWNEVDRILASNYLVSTPTGTLTRDAALAQYHEWQLKDYSLTDLTTEHHGSTIVVTYKITLVGTAGAQPFPSAPLHVMTVWQQEKRGWVMIARSVSQPL